MKSALKWTAIVAVALIVVVISALLVIPNFIDANRYKPDLEKYVMEATGRVLRLSGEVRLSLFPWAGISFSGLSLGNPAGFAEKDFLTVKSFDVRVKLWPLLSQQVEIDRLVVNEPHLLLVTNPDGGVNWDFGAKPTSATPPTRDEAAPATGPSIASLLVGEFSVQNAQVVIIDHGKGSRQEISGLNMALQDLSFDRPVRLTLSAHLNQEPISAEGRFGPVGKPPGQGRVPLELTADALGLLKLKVRGTVEDLITAPRARMEVELAEFSPRRLFAEIGRSLPPTTDARVLERMSFKAGVTADAKAVAVSDAVLELDDSKLKFTASAKEFAKPAITFDLQLDQINIDRYLPPTSAAGPASPPSGQSIAPSRPKIDYAPLRKLVLNGKAKIGQLTVAHAKAEEVSVTITANNGLFTLNPFTLKLYQGRAGGKTVVNVQGESPVTESQLTLDQVQINPLLKDVVDKDFLEGSAQARITLATVGEDPARIKQSLNGRGNLTLSDGAIVGVDLANMVRNAKTALRGDVQTGRKPRTDFAELIVPFSIENGVFHTSETTLKSPLLRLQAAGRADLVSETLDFRVDPKVVGTIKGQGDEKDRTGLGVPVIVSGTFASPSFRPDLEGLARDRLKQALSPSSPEAAPLKEKAGELIKGLLPGKK